VQRAEIAATEWRRLAACSRWTCQRCHRQTDGATATAAEAGSRWRGNWRGVARQPPFMRRLQTVWHTADGVGLTPGLFASSVLRLKPWLRPAGVRELTGLGLDCGPCAASGASARSLSGRNGGLGWLRRAPAHRQRPRPRMPTWAVEIARNWAGGKAPRTQHRHPFEAACPLRGHSTLVRMMAFPSG